MAGWGPKAFANARPVPPLTLGSPAAPPGGLSPWVQAAAPALPDASLGRSTADRGVPSACPRRPLLCHTQRGVEPATAHRRAVRARVARVAGVLCARVQLRLSGPHGGDTQGLRTPDSPGPGGVEGDASQQVSAGVSCSLLGVRQERESGEVSEC